MDEKKITLQPSGIEIVYEQMGNPDSPALFLIMGAGAQLISWPDGFCYELVNRGLQIIRFDNRDAGHSTHVNQAPIPDFQAVLSGDFSSVTYNLSDMAADTIGLMTALKFDAVHLLGASMGGMIAQTIAIEYPSKVKTLTSIMSTTGNPTVGLPDYQVLGGLGNPPSDRQAFIDWRVKVVQAIGSPGYPFDAEQASQMAGQMWDRDHDPLGQMRQFVGTIQSGDRTPLLKKLKTPTLVIHGKADKMIGVSGGIATAEAIPHAKLLLYEGMGHHLPESLWAEFAEEIAELSQKLEA